MENKRNKRAYLWCGCSILCILYGMVVFSAGTGTLFFAVWIALGIGFGIIALADKKGFFGKLPHMVKILMMILLCIGLIFFVAVEGLIISNFSNQGEKDLDYIIVLGAKIYASGPSVVLKYRLDKAVDYLEENPKTKCIVTGGQGHNEPFPEAEGMAAYLKKKGISEDRILLERESKVTAENISGSLELMEEGSSVGIVTNNFHVFRALQIAKSQGLRNVCGIAADSNLVFLPNNLLREFLAEVKFLLI